MLKHLTIENYALIRKLNLTFGEDFNIITGETGTGKSILLGALGLLLGNRADTKVLADEKLKCFVEGEFAIANYSLEPFFGQFALEYDTHCIIRREILPSGRSRAFVNDTPVTLDVLKKLGEKLVDIHSQHENLQLAGGDFQRKTIDTCARNHELREAYETTFSRFLEAQKKLQQTIAWAKGENMETDYLEYQLKQLKDLNLQTGEDKTLIEEQKLLEHAGEIITAYQTTQHCLKEAEEGAILSVLHTLINQLREVGEHDRYADELSERLESLRIELDDIAQEALKQGESIEYEPERANYVNERLSAIYDLQKKHQVQSVDELMQVTENISDRLQGAATIEEQIRQMEEETEHLRKQVLSQAAELSESRKQVIPAIEQGVQEKLSALGMPDGQFHIDLTLLDNPTLNGIDQIAFAFSANKNHPLQPLGRIASGGELSRLSLSLKALLAQNKGLPTIIFDEIDTGVSGQIADKMAEIIRHMARTMQVVAITHLPQIAAKGNCHLKVYKHEQEGKTASSIRSLNEDERVEEIASLLSGSHITTEALQQAKHLLSSS